jgi:hypothetical protein
MESLEHRITGLNLTLQDAKAALAQAEADHEKFRQQGVIDYCMAKIRQLQAERRGSFSTGEAGRTNPEKLADVAQPGVYMRPNVVYTGRRNPDGSVSIGANRATSGGGWSLNEDFARHIMRELPTRGFNYGVESCRDTTMLGAAIIYDFLCDEQIARDYGKRFYEDVKTLWRDENWTLTGEEVRQALITLGVIV